MEPFEPEQYEPSRFERFLSFLRDHSIIPEEDDDNMTMRIGLQIMGIVFVATALWGLLIIKDMGLLGNSEAKLKTILAWQPQDNTIIYDRENNKIGELFSEYHIFTPYQDVPQDLINAIVAIEGPEFLLTQRH